MMPRYVATRWNSMFQLLEFAYRYRKAIDLFTESRENGVRDLELSQEEWAMVKELRDVLKVRPILTLVDSSFADQVVLLSTPFPLTLALPHPARSRRRDVVPLSDPRRPSSMPPNSFHARRSSTSLTSSRLSTGWTSTSPRRPSTPIASLQSGLPVHSQSGSSTSTIP